LKKGCEARIGAETILVDGRLGGRGAGALDVVERTASCSTCWERGKGDDRAISSLSTGEGEEEREDVDGQVI